VLNALTSDPEVWSKTALLITFDENDGFFDHVVSPYPNVGPLNGKSTVPLTDEWFDGTGGTPGGSNGVPGPYGLGVRVPLLVVSPWSKGGYVCSETFDHTSLLRFLEARFGVGEPQITPWRRAVCGDLTAAFDFRSASSRVPKMPSVAAYKPDVAQPTPPSYHPVPPANGALPHQEPGIRPSRRLGYRFEVNLEPSRSRLTLRVRNPGKLGVHLQARSSTVAGAPYSFTVGAGDRLSAALPNPGTYELAVHGPNGFYRRFGGARETSLRVRVTVAYRAGTLTVRLTDRRVGSGRRAVVVLVADAYGRQRRVQVRGTAELTIDTRHSGGWYDVTLSAPSDPDFAYALAGRLESDCKLTSDPQLGRE
jgi:phospholipase C